MTKIVCVGDIHVADRPPANATESYTDDIIVMLKWIADYAVDIEADAVVWAGDVFHHKAPSRNSHELVLKMIDVVRYHRVPLWCVTGNHDVLHQVEAVRDKQPLGVLYAAGLHELKGWHPKLPLFGVPWRETWTDPGDPEAAMSEWNNLPAYAFSCNGGWAVDGYQSKESNLSKALVVTHAPIYPPAEADKQFFELVPTSGPDGISAAMGNVGYVYYGHVHDDHGIFEVDGVTYANVGAISRGSVHEYNLTRKIKVTVWNDGSDEGEVTDGSGQVIQTYGQVGFTEVVVPHKPSSEVFRLEEVLDTKQQKMSLDDFLSDVGSHTLEISSTGSVIAHIQERPDVPPNVKKRAIEILEEVER